LISIILPLSIPEGDEWLASHSSPNLLRLSGMNTPIEKLLINLLKIKSVSGEEKEIGDFLVSELKDFKVKKQYVGNKRFNVIAQKGKSDIWIVAHMDTVPGDVPIKITKDKIYGRGAIDNKGNMAGAIMAGRKLKNINLLFTVSEETDFSGAKKFGSKKGKFIVMEPTNFSILKGQRGAVAFRIVARGRQMHSSLIFKKEDSAVFNLLSVLAKLYRKNWTAFNAVISDGGKKDSIVPKYAEARIFTRPKTLKEYQSTVKYLRRFRANNVRIKIDGTFKPCRSNLFEKGKNALFFSEMIFFKNSLLFGVGGIFLAHAENEYVLRKDLNSLEEKLLALVGKINK